MSVDVAVVAALCGANVAACSHSRRLAEARAAAALRGLVSSGLIAEFGLAFDGHPDSVTVCVSGGDLSLAEGDGCVLWLTSTPAVLSPCVGVLLQALDS